MNSLLVTYSAWGSPKKYISVDKHDLLGAASIREIICGYMLYPRTAVNDIVITDIIPQ